MKKGVFFLCWYWLMLVATALFLFSLTAPNFVLLSWQPYWVWQTWMWSTFFDNRQLLAYTYIGLLLGLMCSYAGLLVVLWNQQTKIHTWIRKNTLRTVVYLVIGVAPLCLGMNGLSYDLFNYAFNAKMVIVYGANPHQQMQLC
jgi:hypothetical protein